MRDLLSVLMAILLFFVGHWYLSLFFQTFFHHRYAAHKMFTMSKFWEKVFYIGSFIAQGSSYLSPYAYGILHRMHHSYADTKKDPHSPKYSKNIFDMMWKTKVIYSGIANNKIEVEEKFKKDVPSWHSFDRFVDKMPIRLLWIPLYFLFYWYFSPHWVWYGLILIHAIMGPFHGAIINWFAHKIGYVNFKVSDTSKNIMPVDIFMLGEGYHNNHHSHPARANFGIKWHEFDPVYPIIVIFDKLGIIQLRKKS